MNNSNPKEQIRIYLRSVSETQRVAPEKHVGDEHKLNRFSLESYLVITNKAPLLLMSRVRKIVIKFDNFSYEIFAPIIIVNCYKNGQNCYQIVKNQFIFPEIHKRF